MFAEHQPMIRSYALANPTAFRRVATFVILTIRQPLRLVPAQMADVDHHGRDSRYLFGSKRAAFDWLEANAGRLHALTVDLDRRRPEGWKVDLLLAYMECPGLGAVKAGFLAQLAVGEIGCIDGHNLNRFGLPVDAFKINTKLKPATVRQKVAAYVDACERLGGGVAQLWDDWCAYVAGRRGWDVDAHEVSRLHATVFGLPA